MPVLSDDDKRAKDYKSLMTSLYQDLESFKKYYTSPYLNEGDKKYAFWEAMALKNKSVVFFILEKEEDPLSFLTNEYGSMSKILHRVHSVHETIQEVLLKFYPSLPKKEQMSVLHACVTERQWDLLEILLEMVDTEKILKFTDNNDYFSASNPELFQKTVLKAELSVQINSSSSPKKKM